MRRDHFTVAVRDHSTEKPTLDIAYDGPRETLTGQLTDTDSELLTVDAIDAAFRLQDTLHEDDAMGVFSLTHRLTGEYLLEVNIDARDVLALVQHTRDASEDEDSDETSYCIQIQREDDETIVYDMSSLFVYDADGELLKQHSLIPSGVEL